MKQTDKSDSLFEQQLRQSARRLRDKQNYELPVRKMPYRPTRVTWVAVAVAAAVGRFVGITFPLNGEQPAGELAACVVPDTVVTYRDRIVHDTVIQQVKIPVEVRTEKVAADNRKRVNAELPGCNMECDGIDYARLVGM